MGNFERRLERSGELDGTAPYDRDVERKFIEQEEEQEDDTLSFNAQELIDSGMAWRLEGHIGRQCMAAIEQGYAVLGPEPRFDYYGNRVPARHEVQPGTVGSVEYANDLRAKRGEEPLEVASA